MDRAGEPFGRKALLAGAAVAAALAAGAVAWYGVVALAEIFGAVLIGIFLGGLADRLRAFRPMPRGRAVTIVLVALLALLGLSAWIVGAMLSEQVGVVLQSLPAGEQKLKALAGQLPWLSRLAGVDGKGGAGLAPAAAAAGGAVARALEAGMNAFLVFFGGVFLAYRPGYYEDGLVALLPARRRARARDVLDELSRSLWLWTLGRLVVMAVIGASHVLLFWAIGLPSPFALGLLAGLLAFIPNLGPTLATVPAAIVALGKDPSLVLWVIVAHAAVQTAEGYLLTPLVQSKMVEVPAFVTICSLLLGGALLGAPGLMIATPAACAVQVLVRALYVEDVLGERAPALSAAS